MKFNPIIAVTPRHICFMCSLGQKESWILLIHNRKSYKGVTTRKQGLGAALRAPLPDGLFRETIQDFPMDWGAFFHLRRQNHSVEQHWIIFLGLKQLCVFHLLIYWIQGVSSLRLFGSFSLFPMFYIGYIEDRYLTCQFINHQTTRNALGPGIPKLELSALVAWTSGLFLGHKIKMLQG